MGWFASWMLNPWMLGVGALAMASPIIIHLLNRRRFKIVDWAAMRFLIDADKKNRKRIRIENFILLMLRCLAMVLLGFMISRPFLPSSIGDLLGNTKQFERIIILDDSLSQQVVGHDNLTLFERSVHQLRDLINQFAIDDNAEFLTLYLTSRPTRPLVTNEPVTVETVGSLTQTLEELQCSDQRAQYTETLQEIQRYVSSGRSDLNRMILLLSDMREIDWATPELLASSAAPNQLINQMTEQVAQISIVDVGNDETANLAIIDFRPQDLLVSNTIVGFAVTVANYSNRTAENVQVRFREGESPPMIETIDSLAPNSTETVQFRFLFKLERDYFDDFDLRDQLDTNRLNYQLIAEIVADGANLDVLPTDSSRFYAARVLQGIPVLVVDGDPSPLPERSESFFLERIGVEGTGLIVDVVTASELASVSLSKYKVIFLCNVDEASEDRIISLEQWVNNGGGIVFMPGSVVRASRFNESFFKEGEGLSPLKLLNEDGDPLMGNWVYFDVKDPNHPALRVAQDRDVNLTNVEIFSWWEGTVLETQLGQLVSVPMRLTNESSSPAMAEKSFGKGKTVSFAIPADADWGVWPAHPTYICVIWDLVNYLVGTESTVGNATVGNPITYPVDLSRYDIRVGLTDPAGEKVENLAVSDGDSEESKRSVLYQVTFDDLLRRGFYEMMLEKKTGETDVVLFAANSEERESNLKRLDINSLGDSFFSNKVKLLSSDQLSGRIESRSASAIWPTILLLLATLLGLEQFLGWLFGRKR